MRRVLMLAYVFPPFFSVGGSIRAVKFVKYLPELGWLPLVLTIDDSRNYEIQRKEGSETLLQDIPGHVKIYRTGAGEPSEALLEKGRAARTKNWLAAAVVTVLSKARRWAYRYLLLPDRCIAWLPFAVSMGRRITREEHVDALFATCPPYSAAVIGAVLKMLTRKPLILDFRDDWIDTPWHESKLGPFRRIDRWLERWVVKRANRVALVTQRSKNAFVDRYRSEPDDKFVLIPNGCDLEDFALLQQTVNQPSDSQFTIVHAGHLNDPENWRRSPRAFLEALSRLRQKDPELEDHLRVAFTGRLPKTYQRMVEEMSLSRMVRETGHLPRDEFVQLMQSAGMLLAINYDGWSTIIPGKIYEYWAVGGPPILLLSCSGAAQSLVDRHCLGTTVNAYDVEAIEHAVLSAYRRWEMGEPMRITTAGIENYDRRRLTQELARTLTAMCCQVRAVNRDSGSRRETGP